MNTPSKRAASAPAKPAQSKPFIRFYHSQRLRAKTLAAIEAVENTEDASAHAPALAEVLVELLNGAMDYFFMRPLKLAKVNFIVLQSASIGMAATQQLVGTLTRSVIARMNTPQLVSLCGSLRRFME